MIFNVVNGNKKPTGEIDISANGEYDVTQYASANVNVPLPEYSGTATEAQVLSGQTFYSDTSVKQTGTMQNNGALNSSFDDINDAVTVNEGYYSGGAINIAQTEKSKFVAKNIRNGVSLMGVVGEFDNPITVNTQTELNALLNQTSNAGLIVKYNNTLYELEINENYQEPTPTTYTVNIVNNTIFKNEAYTELFYYTITNNNSTVYTGNGNTTIQAVAGSATVRINTTIPNEVLNNYTFSWVCTGDVALNEYALNNNVDGYAVVDINGTGTITLIATAK